MTKNLLSILPYANNPSFDAIYKKLGLKVTAANTLRKALSLVKKISPDIVVAEFIYAPTYGSQLSNFESLFAAAQSYANHAHFIALTHPDDLQHIKKIAPQYNHCVILTLPVTAEQLEKPLRLILQK